VAELNIPPAPSIEGAQHLHSGKVRDLYELPGGELLMVASDRISIFDFVLDTTIPDKGEILTRMSLWWFDQLADLVPNHVISTDVPEQVRGRAVVCERLAMYPVECVVRGYLTGSGLLDYQATALDGHSVCGIALPAGLEDGSRLPAPIFTPATKAELGDHDENVSYETVAADLGESDAGELRELTLAVYSKAVGIAAERGIIIADTKLEFGRSGGAFVLGDELLTPDSSRFWPVASYREGASPESFDKQYVRNWLDAIGFKRKPPAPAMPPDVATKTSEKYQEAARRLIA